MQNMFRHPGNWSEEISAPTYQRRLQDISYRPDAYQEGKRYVAESAHYHDIHAPRTPEMVSASSENHKISGVGYAYPWQTHYGHYHYPYTYPLVPHHPQYTVYAHPYSTSSLVASQHNISESRRLAPSPNPILSKDPVGETCSASSGDTPNQNLPRKLAQHECPTCKKTFSRKYNYRSHLLCHSNDRKFACGICPARFARRHDLKRHERSLHSEDRPYKCELCNLSFSRKDGLRRHMEGRHQNTRSDSVTARKGAISL